MGLRAPPGCGAGGGYEPGGVSGIVLVPGHPPQIWAIIERFESWWAWLADFRADDGGLVTGNVLHGTVIPPIPYRLRLDVRLQQCDRPRLDAADGGPRAQVAWSLRMHSAPLRVAARVAYPLMRWGHDGVVDMAVAGFR